MRMFGSDIPELLFHYCYRGQHNTTEQNKFPGLHSISFQIKSADHRIIGTNTIENKAKQNTMAPITIANAPILRHYRCSHGRRLVILLRCLSCYSLGWIVTRLVASSPTTSTNILFEVQQHKPRNNTSNHSPSVAASIHENGIALFRNCLGGWNPTNCGAINGTTSITGTTAPQDPMATNRNSNANENASTELGVATGHYYRHPNFTFEFPLCLVHVGKTAGSTISCGLGLMYANCEGMPRQPPIPHVDYFHMRKNNCRRIRRNGANSNPGNDQDIATTATFLMTVRNPLARIRSWFEFEKDRLPMRRNRQDEQRLRWKRGMLFAECYDNFVDLVTNGLEPMQMQSNIISGIDSNGNNSNNDVINDNGKAYEISAERPVNMTCQERAWAAILGVREFSYHEWYNYEHYWTALQPYLYEHQNSKDDSKPSFPSSAPSLLVLRTEHLAEDWSKISKEDLFRQVNKGSHHDSTNNRVPFSVLNGSSTTTSLKSPSHSIPDNYSNRFWTNLCRAMCPEIQIYQHILQNADNMNASEVKESIREVQTMCPQYGSNEGNTCSGIPQFPLLGVPRRKYYGETAS